MNRHVPRSGVALLALFVVTGLLLLAFLSARFGGPTVRAGQPFVLRAEVPDTQGLSVRSDVRLRGVLVGHVARVAHRGGRAALELVLDGEPVRLRRGTTLRVGTKTALGEPYVDLSPGPSRAAALRSGVRLPASALRPAVEVDEALRTLDAPTRRRAQGTLRSLGDGTASPRAAAEVSGAVTGLRAAVDAVGDLTMLLQDQSGDLSRIVLAGGRVVDELARRTGRVAALVRDGRRTLEAVGSRDAALRATVDEAPRLLRSARAALRETRPLVAEVRPVLADLRAAAPGLASTARTLGPVARDVDAILDGGPALEHAARPVIGAAPSLLAAAGPAVRRAEPALANAATIGSWLSPRRRTVASWFSNTAAIGTNGDAKGRWARFFVFMDPATLLGGPSDLPTNAYTPPDDATAPRAYRPGDFDRLLPTVPPASP